MIGRGAASVAYNGHVLGGVYSFYGNNGRWDTWKKWWSRSQCGGKGTEALEVLSKEIAIGAKKSGTYFRAVWHKEVSHSRRPRWMIEIVVCWKSVRCRCGRDNGWMVRKIAVWQIWVPSYRRWNWKWETNKIITAEDVGPPPPPPRKSGRKFGSTGIDGMSWEENQGSVEVRKHITERTTMKKTVQNWKVFFEPGKKEWIGMR